MIDGILKARVAPLFWRQLDRAAGRKSYRQSAYVLPRHQLVICCVPKTGTIAIRKAVMESLGLDGDDRDLRNTQRLSSDYWVEAREAARYRFPVVGIIREPVERFVSAYTFRYRSGPGWSSRFDWLRGIDSLDHCINAAERGRFARDVHFWPQVDILRAAADPWPYRQLESWWRHVRSLSALPLPDLEKVNVTAPKKPVATAEQEARIKRIYRDDVAAYEASCRRHS